MYTLQISLKDLQSFKKRRGCTLILFETQRLLVRMAWVLRLSWIVLNGGNK